MMITLKALCLLSSNLSYSHNGEQDYTSDFGMRRKRSFPDAFIHDENWHQISSFGLALYLNNSTDESTAHSVNLLLA